MADKLDEATLIIVDDSHFNFLQWFASCNPISLLILLAWLFREIWRKIKRQPNIISEVREIEQRIDAND